MKEYVKNKRKYQIIQFLKKIIVNQVKKIWATIYLWVTFRVKFKIKMRHHAFKKDKFTWPEFKLDPLKHNSRFNFVGC